MTPSESSAALKISSPGAAPESFPLRIATYNIHKGVSGFALRNRIHDLRLGVKKLNADIMFLQEVQGRNDAHSDRFSNWPEEAQHDFLASEGFPEAVYGRNAVHDKGAFVSDHGNALLSRFPLLSHENLDISDHRFEARGLLHCEIEWAGQRVHCICAHLGLFEGSRQRQVVAMIARINEHVPTNAPLIIAGDFNDWRVRLGQTLRDRLGVREVFDQEGSGDDEAGAGETPAQRLKRRLRATFERGINDPLKPARTFPSAFPILRLDRVYVRGFKVTKARVMHGTVWRKLSDHAPIVVDLYLDTSSNRAS